MKEYNLMLLDVYGTPVNALTSTLCIEVNLIVEIRVKCRFKS